MKTIIQEIASLLQARENCRKSGNKEWESIHTANLDRIKNDLLPSGSGIDCGTKIDLTRTKPDCIVLIVPFHCMNECGYYDGWREYTLRIRPAFQGIEISIQGRDYNGLKDYLADLFHHALTQPIPEGFFK